MQLKRYENSGLQPEFAVRNPGPKAQEMHVFSRTILRDLMACWTLAACESLPRMPKEGANVLVLLTSLKLLCFSSMTTVLIALSMIFLND